MHFIANPAFVWWPTMTRLLETKSLKLPLKSPSQCAQSEPGLFSQLHSSISITWKPVLVAFHFCHKDWEPIRKDFFCVCQPSRHTPWCNPMGESVLAPIPSAFRRFIYHELTSCPVLNLSRRFSFVCVLFRFMSYIILPFMIIKSW